MFLPASLKYRKRNSFGSQTVLVPSLGLRLALLPATPPTRKTVGVAALLPVTPPTRKTVGGQKSGSGNETTRLQVVSQASLFFYEGARAEGERKKRLACETRLQGHQQFNSVVT